MPLHAAVDVAHLTRFANRKHPLWWGVAGLIAIEVTVVASFIASYFYLALMAPEWPPPGFEIPPVLWPTVNIALLLASSGTMYWAGWGINRGSRKILVAGTAASVLLACTVLVLRYLEFRQYDFRWDSHAYASLMWTITGFHFVHVASAIVGTAVVSLLAWRGYFTKERQLGVVVDTLYWYFVAGAWIPLYLTLYWAPRVL